MTILVVYGTLSGSTMTAADIIATTLRQNGNEVSEVSADLASRDQLAANDMMVIGSPSWEDEGKDGQPLPEVRKFLSGLTSADLSGKKVAIFGLGDTSYPHFCGAVDVLEGMLKERGVSPVVPSLRVDRYYSNPKNEQDVVEWAKQIASG